MKKKKISKKDKADPFYQAEITYLNEALRIVLDHGLYQTEESSGETMNYYAEFEHDAAVERLEEEFHFLDGTWISEKDIRSINPHIAEKYWRTPKLIIERHIPILYNDHIYIATDSGYPPSAKWNLVNYKWQLVPTQSRMVAIQLDLFIHQYLKKWQRQKSNKPTPHELRHSLKHSKWQKNSAKHKTSSKSSKKKVTTTSNTNSQSSDQEKK